MATKKDETRPMRPTKAGFMKNAQEACWEACEKARLAGDLLASGRPLSAPLGTSAGLLGDPKEQIGIYVRRLLTEVAAAAESAGYALDEAEGQ